MAERLYADRVLASPAAKALASERGIDLGAIKGSGPNGRIVKEDVLNFKGSVYKMADRGFLFELCSEPCDSIAPAAAPASAGATAPKAPTPAPGAAFVDIPLSNVRKVLFDCESLESMVY